MRRYIPSRRSRKNIIETSQLRDDFIRQLSKESEALLAQFTTQFSQDLQTQVNQAFQGIVAGQQTNSPITPANGEVGTIGSVGQLLSTGVRYLISRPKTSRDSSETGRSIQAGAQLRVSSAQVAADAQTQLNRGQKNL